MSGRASRLKGVRGEYLLRDYLRSLGYSSDRVPLSGAAQGAAYKGDVVASKDGKSIVFEMKFRKDEYKSIYAVLDGFTYKDAVALNYQDACFVFGYSLPTVLGANYYYNVTPLEPKGKVQKKDFRALRKLLGLKKLLGTADILVLKINNKPLMFVKYS